MTSAEIRSRFLEFFKARGHAILPSAPLVPENDPTVLFNTAGMQPLVPYLMGQTHPQGTRLADVQKCVRTNDIEEVGDNRHLTFFEMMGNWSLGDYFKKESIEWSYELLTSKEEGFGLDPNRLYVTCFEGDENAPKDEESAAIWKEIFEKNGVTGNRIFFLPAKNNWWSPGDNGPCGPDTEMFYDVSGNLANGLTHEEYVQHDDAGDLIEIWNNVFMEYEKKDGKVIGKLATRNVDTGSGLERVVTVVQGKSNVFETDLFTPIIDALTGEHTGASSDRARRIVADHMRAAVFLTADGVLPGNKDQGYILRRLIRRAAVQASQELHIKSLTNVMEVIINTYEKAYPVLNDKRSEIFEVITNEEERFRQTLDLGMTRFSKLLIKNLDTGENVGHGFATPQFVFDLYQSYGFPIELTYELLNKHNVAFHSDSKEKVQELLKEHQEKSRAGADQKFKGGLGDTSEMSVKYHTATHLLHQALRDVLGDHVQQKGSNITPERLRFDFVHPQKMTDEEKKKVEEIVNGKIAENLPMQMTMMPKADAEASGALHFFGDKYGDEVSIYYIGETLENAYSKEFCGGPHVTNIGTLGRFKIQKEEAVSAGVRRIKAVLE